MEDIQQGVFLSILPKHCIGYFLSHGWEIPCALSFCHNIGKPAILPLSCFFFGNHQQILLMQLCATSGYVSFLIQLFSLVVKSFSQVSVVPPLQSRPGSLLPGVLLLLESRPGLSVTEGVWAPCARFLPSPAPFQIVRGLVGRPGSTVGCF